MGRSQIKGAIRLLLVGALTLLPLSVCAAPPQSVSSADNSVSISNTISLVPKEINNHNSDGVSRIACTLTGVPNTGHRIDGATLIVGKERLTASDIDGIDFKRYFQFEEEGEIEIEIDFPRRRRFSPNDRIELTTPAGTISAPLGKASTRIK